MLRKHGTSADTVDITTDGSGNGSATITFKNPFNNNDYTIVVLAQETDTGGTLSVSAKTAKGCTVSVNGSSVVSGTLTVGYIATQNDL